jgi:arylsulfatase A-like enzyme
VGTGATLAAFQAQAGAKGESSMARQPNVILILADDLGYGDLSCYGATDIRTPHIDRIAAQGVRFERFYANCPVCSPTRASVLTGCYPDGVGVPGVIRTHREDSWGKLAEDAVLLPSVLSKAGYHSAIIGKWHLGLESPDTPTERGFDHFHGFLGDMMDDYYTHRRHDINYIRLGRNEIDPEGHATDLFTAWAVDHIAERAKTERPFFLYLAYNAPHTPIQPPQEWVDRVLQREPGIDPKRATLAALIEHLDDGVGRVMQALELAGVADHTLVFFVSDNGGQLDAGADNGPLRAGKQDMYEGGIRVPMCARWPGRIPEGATSDRVALTMDLFPTVCEACGAPWDQSIDGRSILPALLGQAQAEEDRTLFWVRREGGQRYGGRDYYAARRGSMKLLQNSPFEPLRLYDLASDPREEMPLPNEHPAFRPLFDALQKHINDTGTVPWQRNRGPQDARP